MYSTSSSNVSPELSHNVSNSEVKREYHETLANKALHVVLNIL